MKLSLIPTTAVLILCFLVMEGMSAETAEEKNVIGSKLLLCNDEPKTGYNRTGFCNVPPNDPGCHAVCVPVTDEFLTYTKSKGNDLTAANAEKKFPGLTIGDRWCVCAKRWKQAFEAGKAPFVVLEASNKAALDDIGLDVLEKFKTKF